MTTGHPLSVAMVTVTFVDTEVNNTVTSLRRLSASVNNVVTWVLNALCAYEVNKQFLLL